MSDRPQKSGFLSSPINLLIALIWLSVLCTTSLLLIHTISCVHYSLALTWEHFTGSLFYFLLKPVLMTLGGILLVIWCIWLHHLAKKRAFLMVLPFCALLLGVWLWSPLNPEETLRSHSALLLTSYVVGLALSLVKLLIFRTSAGLSRWFLLVTHPLTLALWLGVYDSPSVQTQVNRFGLVSFPPDSTVSEDLSSNSNKDNYPVCEYQNNSLGYRDIEPDFKNRRPNRVLLIGDSFIWGDGIPSNDQTLSAKLRAELEKRAPGQFSVYNAAYPGLGLYGYYRNIEKLYSLYEPTQVIIGYLGESDHNPFDAQSMQEALPRNGFFRTLVINSKAVQNFHEVSMTQTVTELNRQATEKRARNLVTKIGKLGAKAGFRTIIIDYSPLKKGSAKNLSFEDLPESLDFFVLPESWRYPGHRNKFWYARDHHPRPKLNEVFSRSLAQSLVNEDFSVASQSSKTGMKTLEKRVLPPSASNVVGRAFKQASAEAEIHLKGALVRNDHVQARLCSTSDDSCFMIRLSDPNEGCPDGLNLPHWCLRVTEGTAPEVASAALKKAFSTDDDDPWIVPVTHDDYRPDGPNQDEEQPSDALLSTDVRDAILLFLGGVVVFSLIIFRLNQRQKDQIPPKEQAPPDGEDKGTETSETEEAPGDQTLPDKASPPEAQSESADTSNEQNQREGGPPLEDVEAQGDSSKGKET